MNSTEKKMSQKQLRDKYNEIIYPMPIALPKNVLDHYYGLAIEFAVQQTASLQSKFETSERLNAKHVAYIERLEKEKEELKQENALLLDVCESYKKGFAPEHDHLHALNKELEERVAELSRRLELNLPEDCVLGYPDVKFCSHRNGDGNECKQCINSR